MRLIDADKLAKKLRGYADEFPTQANTFDIIASGLESDENFAPTLTLDDIVPHGRWYSRGTHGDFEEKRCSVCDGLLLVKWYDRTMEYNYCPNCGAKMDLEG